MINHVGSRSRCSKKEKKLPFKTVGHIHLTFHVYMLGPCMPMCARYEVSVTKTVARRSVQTIMMMMPTTTIMGIHKEQFMSA